MTLKCSLCDQPLFWLGGSTWETLVGHSSDPGHNHNDNCLKRTYFCSNHHAIVIQSIRRTCPSCDWKGKITCFCHQGLKLDEWPDNQVEVSTLSTMGE